ncbi:zinc metalloproteinase-disintegrin-like MTP4 [Eleutherodactylus coqui]|uniref:zinc metalloproteinase-disintegrin-like MTP4 n=1 Tax=Eleutherodactylus coqui TaxID=57060 RepID=UPI003462F15C
MLMAALFLLAVLSHQSQGFNEIPAGQNYEVVFPRKLHAQHKRDVQQSEYPDVVQYEFEVDGQPMVLHLEKTEDLISKTYTETHYLKDGSRVTTSPEIKDHCFYQGYVKNTNSSQVTLSACNGLSGIIASEESKFLIQPLKMSETEAHAVYPYHEDETPKTCGVDDTIVSRAMSKLDFSIGRQEEQTFQHPRKYIEMYIVADNSMYNRFNYRRRTIRQRIFNIVNFVNQVYKPLNIFVALTGMEIWNNGNKFEVHTSSKITLHRFSAWIKKDLHWKPHDNAQFLTDIDFDGIIVGVAWIGGMCSSNRSAGVIQDYKNDYIRVARTVAHELGHNLGMRHDNDNDNDDCCTSCIMAANSSPSRQNTFSSCSHQHYQNFIKEYKPLCMNNKPKMGEIISTPVCGNKFRERGEECDCGSEEECTDRCCDAATCQLKEGAQCSEEDTCCSDCRLKSAGSVCRPAKDECDLSDVCDGRSATCSSDRFQMNGSPCNNGEGYCYYGTCPTLRNQCETYWGAGSVPAKDSCYETIPNNCPRSGFRQCGVLYCSGGRRQPTINGFKSCRISGCKTLFPEVLVKDGTKCENGRESVLHSSTDSYEMCINGQCAEIPIQPEICAAGCPGHSVCDHEMECRCEEGWAPPYCDRRVRNRP